MTAMSRFSTSQEGDGVEEMVCSLFLRSWGTLYAYGLLSYMNILSRIKWKPQVTFNISKCYAVVGMKNKI